MSFWDDAWTGFQKPFEWGYHIVDRAQSTATSLVDSASSLLSGNFLIYAGIGLVAVLVLPKLLEKVL